MIRSISLTSHGRKAALVVAGSAAALAVSAISAVPASSGAFPGVNGPIAYTESLTGFKDQIWSVNADGTNKIRLSNAPDNDNTRANWNANGDQVAYIRSTDDPTVTDLYVMNADGTGARPVVTGIKFGSYPSWSPDGSKIAYNENLGTIWTVNADGSNKQVLIGEDPNGTEFGTSPQWSPDGTKIAFSKIIAQNVNCTGGVDAQLYLMNTSGGNLEQLTNDPCSSYEPTWSPDGQRIAYTTDRGFDEEIWVMDAQPGAQQQQLTDAIGNDSSPSWSPDGTMIAFETLRNIAAEIWTMNADGTNQQTTGIEGTEPSWGPGEPTETTLAVKAVKKSKKLKVDKKYKVVKSAETNGEITKVKIVCKIDGDKVNKKTTKKTCGAKEKKKSDPTTAKVIAKPKCDTKMKIKAVVTAQYQATDPAKWKRTWKVKKNTGPNC
jgi:dipeptidyl aminopeptidase/acylaminoacyl peptidase